MNLNRHRRLDSRMWIIVLNSEILVLEIKDNFHFRIYLHGGQMLWCSRHLKHHLLHVIGINMGIAEGMNKLAATESANLRNHHGEQRIGRNIERNAKENIGPALI